ncbi:MAG: alpha/beta fold hydrolase [Chloroflexi bacterium]|nr:alpha/beta fold hydrolase [Chloroflexota bacterium]
MKAKMFELGVLGLLAVALLTACRFNPLDTVGATRVTGSGKVVNETRNVSGFDGLIIEGVGKINIDRTGTESLSITTDDNLLQYIDTRVRGGKLVIEFKPKIWVDRFSDLSFNLTVKDLNLLQVTGAVSIDAKNLQGDQMTVSIDGAGTTNLAGKVDQLTVSLKGMGTFNSENLQAKRATVTNDGTSAAVVRVSDSLNATVSGIGSIEYIGNPQVTKNISGPGTVRQRLPLSSSVIDEKVKFTVDTKEIDGILTHPAAPAPYPAIVLLQGAERAGAQHPFYTEHAENLVRAGFAVLRYDGPGWGGGALNDAGFETLEYRTQEAIAAVKYLQSRPDINSSGVGLVGGSQGGWVCLMAAATYDGVAFIIPVSGAGVTPAEQEVYRVEAMSRAAGFDNDEIAKAVLMRRLMVDILLNEPMYQQINLAESNRLGNGPWREMTELAYRPQPKDLAAEFVKVIKIFKSIKDERWAKFLSLDQVLPMFDNMPPQAWGDVKAQMRAVTIVDPAKYLVRIHVPVLAIFGENDTFVPVEKSIVAYKKYLGEAGNQAFTYKVFANADHGIRVIGFADGYFDLMVNWLRNLPVGKREGAIK